MFKRDDYIRTKSDSVFSNWQGFAGSMLLRKPFPETEGSRKTLPDYSSSPRDLGPKIPVGASRHMEDLVGRYRVQGSVPGPGELGLAVINHYQGRKVEQDDGLVASLCQTESIKYRLLSYGTSIAQHNMLKKLGDTEFTSQRNSGLSQTILPSPQKKIANRTEDMKNDFAEEEDEISCNAAEKSNFLASIHRLSRSRPQLVTDKHDDVVDESASVCGILLQDGTTCTTAPIKGRKRCSDHKGQRISHVSQEKLILSEDPTRREWEETENICGVILPDMVPCRRKPVSRRKRCEDHKGMRTNAFSFLMNPTDRDKIFKENKAKPETSVWSMNEEDSGLGLLCEATTKNGLPCTRSAPKGSKRCWQHKDKTLDNRSSKNVQSETVYQVICSVKLYNGSVCEKPPVKGRKRCEEHKGMRITS